MPNSVYPAFGINKFTCQKLGGILCAAHKQGAMSDNQIELLFQRIKTSSMQVVCDFNSYDSYKAENREISQDKKA